MRVLAMALLTTWAAAGQSSAPAEWRVLPLVVNGKVFVTTIGRLTIYGLLP